MGLLVVYSRPTRAEMLLRRLKIQDYTNEHSCFRRKRNSISRLEATSFVNPKSNLINMERTKVVFLSGLLNLL